MATTLASLVVRVGADVTGVTAGMNTLDKRIKATKKQFGSLQDSTLSLTKGLQVLAGAAAMGFALKKTFDLGAAVEETASKFRTVFGPATQEAQAFLDDFANSAGLTTQAGQELLATTGAITQGLGFTQEASAEVSERMVRMAADIASFNNTQGGAERVTRSFISALNGETESLKEAANVVVLQADVMDKARQMTGKATDEITRQDKALATLELIAERAGVAMGDLGRTMDSPANRARKLTAQVLDLRDGLAHGLMPAFGVILDELSNIGGPAGFPMMTRAIRENGNRIAAWTKFAIESFKMVALAFAAPIRAAWNLGQAIGHTARIMGNFLRGDIAGAKAAFADLTAAKDGLNNSVLDVIDGFEAMRIAAGEAWGTMEDGSEEVVNLTQKLLAAEEQARATAEALQKLAGMSLDASHLTAGGMSPEEIRKRKDRQFFGLRIPMGPVSRITGDGPGFDSLGATLRDQFKGFFGQFKSMFDPKAIMSNAVGGLLSGGLSTVMSIGTDLLTKGLSSLFGGLSESQKRLQAAIERNTKAQSASADFLKMRLDAFLASGSITIGGDAGAGGRRGDPGGDPTESIAIMAGDAQAILEAIVKATNLEAVGEGLGSVQATVASLIPTRLRLVMEAMAKALGVTLGVEGGFEAFAEQLAKATGGLDALGETANKVNDALRNVPSGFRVALARFNATSVGGSFGIPGDPHGGGRFGLPGSMSIGTVNVYANDPEEFDRKVRQKAARGGAYTVQPAYLRA